MQTFSLFCILCCFPALFCFKLGSELRIFDGSENDVAEFEPEDSLIIDQEQFDLTNNEKTGCTCNKKESECVCNAIESRHGIHVSVEFKIDRVSEGCSCGCLKVKALFHVGNTLFAKEMNMNKKEIKVCKEIFGVEYCFEIGAQQEYGVSGCIQMTKPSKVFIGCFHLKE